MRSQPQRLNAVMLSEDGVGESSGVVESGGVRSVEVGCGPSQAISVRHLRGKNAAIQWFLLSLVTKSLFKCTTER